MNTPEGYIEISDLVAQWEADPARREALQSARLWLAEILAKEQP